jgi:hypothetical protein
VSERDNGQWYTNKDLFELINALQAEMRETRAIIKKYNGLYEKVDTVRHKIEQIEYEQTGKNKTKEAIRQWGGWIFGLITLIVLLYTTFLV